MHEFEIPRSVEDFLASGKLKTVVDNLLGNLTGSAPVETREEVLAYNQGILLAVQVRADMVKMLFELFETCVASQAKSPAGALIESFDATDHEINDVWNDPMVSSSFYRNDDGKMKGEHIMVALELTSDLEFVLYATRYVGDAYLQFHSRTTAALKQVLWKRELDGDDDPILAFTACKWADFVADTDAQIDRMRGAVRELFAKTLLT